MSQSVKTSGREFKRFYTDPTFWPDGGDTWHDETLIRADGTALSDGDDPCQVPDTCLVEIEAGWVVGIPQNAIAKQLKGIEVPEEMSLMDYYQLWHKQQTTVTMVVECGRNQVDAVIAAVTAAGGQVHR